MDSTQQEPLFRVSLFGPTEILARQADGTWQAVPRKLWGYRWYTISLLRRLLCVPGRSLARWSLMECLWPDKEEAFEHLLATAASELARIFGKTHFERCRNVYRLAGQAVIWTDLDAVETLLKQIERQGPTRADTLPLLETVLTYMERGDFLAEETGLWASARQEMATRQQKRIRHWLVDHYLAAGNVLQAEKQYHALVYDLLDEKALVAWIAFLRDQGMSHDARLCYQHAQRFFVEQGIPLEQDGGLVFG